MTTGGNRVDIIVKSKNCDVPAKVKEEALEKVAHATRIYDRLLGVELVFSEEHNPRIAAPAVVELTGRTKGHHIRAEGSAGDHRGATDIAMAKFERQLRRYKTRLVDRKNGRKRSTPAPVGDGQLTSTSSATLRSAPAAPQDDDAPRIVRTKQFVLSPMLPEDAALQLEMLDHEFFVFANAATGDCNVIYRRKDGQLGLIEAVAEATAGV
jgi:putative sigma-54 modulation protein